MSANTLGEDQERKENSDEMGGTHLPHSLKDSLTCISIPMTVDAAEKNTRLVVKTGALLHL